MQWVKEYGYTSLFFFCSTTFSSGHHFCYVYKTRSALKERLYSSKSEFFLEELTPIEKGGKKGGGVFQLKVYVKTFQILIMDKKYE